MLVTGLLIASSVWSATPFSDTFTGANGTNLDAHTPTAGTSWTEEYASASGQLQIQSNTIVSQFTGTSQGSFQAANATYGSNNYTVSITLTTFANNFASRNVWIGCRYANSGGFDGYFASISPAVGTNDVIIYRVDNGTPTKISGSEDSGSTTGDVMMLECNGNQIGLKKNGSYVINPITDATYSTGMAILGMGEILGLTQFEMHVSDVAVDNFSVDTIASPIAGEFGPLKRRGQ